jgi:uncharacterized membrane protein
MYISSLVSRERFSVNNIILPLIVSITLTSLYWPIFIKNLFYPIKRTILIFSSHSIQLISILAIYLLITLIIVVFITKNNKGPLRSIN